MRTVSVATQTHGRVLVEDAADVSSRGLIVAFHGYGQNAEDILNEVRQIPGAAHWKIASVQALHRFYGRDHQKVIASWMTREDRELAIADNVAYVDQLVEQVGAPQSLIYLGFSQGASMAYRAALLGRHPATGIIALGGDIPPELKTGPSHAWPPTLIGAGAADTWYTAEKLKSDTEFLSTNQIAHEVVRFSGGHEWTDEFKSAAGEWIGSLTCR